MDNRKRKTIFRAWRRGFRELDLLMGSFADSRVPAMAIEELEEFERLLSLPDWEIYAWIVGQRDPPPNQRGPILDELMAFKFEARGG